MALRPHILLKPRLRAILLRAILLGGILLGAILLGGMLLGTENPSWAANTPTPTDSVPQAPAPPRHEPDCLPSQSAAPFAASAANKLLIALPADSGTASKGTPSPGNRLRAALIRALKPLSTTAGRQAATLARYPLGIRVATCAPGRDADARQLARAWEADAILWYTAQDAQSGQPSGLRLTLMSPMSALMMKDRKYPIRYDQHELEDLELADIPATQPALVDTLLAWHLYRLELPRGAVQLVERALSKAPEPGPERASLLRLKALALLKEQILSLPDDPLPDDEAAVDPTGSRVLLKEALENCGEPVPGCKVKVLNALAYVEERATKSRPGPLFRPAAPTASADPQPPDAALTLLEQALALVAPTGDVTWRTAQQWRIAQHQRPLLSCLSKPLEVEAVGQLLQTIEQQVRTLNDDAWLASVLLQRAEFIGQHARCSYHTYRSLEVPPDVPLVQLLLPFEQQRRLAAEAYELIQKVHDKLWARDVRESLGTFTEQNRDLVLNYALAVDSEDPLILDVLLKDATDGNAECLKLEDWIRSYESPERELRQVRVALRCWERMPDAPRARSSRDRLSTHLTRLTLETAQSKEQAQGLYEQVFTLARAQQDTWSRLRLFRTVFESQEHFELYSDEQHCLEAAVEFSRQVHDLMLERELLLALESFYEEHGSREQVLQAEAAGLAVWLLPANGGGTASPRANLSAHAPYEVLRALPAPETPQASSLSGDWTYKNLLERFARHLYEAHALQWSARAFVALSIGEDPTQSADFCLTAASLWMEAGQWDEALKALAPLSKRFPLMWRSHIYRILDTRAAILAQQSRWHDVQLTLMQIFSWRKRYPKDKLDSLWESRLMYLLGTAYARTGDRVLASRWFQRSVTLPPSPSRDRLQEWLEWHGIGSEPKPPDPKASRDQQFSALESLAAYAHKQNNTARERQWLEQLAALEVSNVRWRNVPPAGLLRLATLRLDDHQQEGVEALYQRALDATSCFEHRDDCVNILQRLGELLARTQESTEQAHSKAQHAEEQDARAPGSDASGADAGHLKALEYYTRAAKGAALLGDLRWQADLLEHMGQQQLALKHGPEALDCFTRSAGLVDQGIFPTWHQTLTLEQAEAQKLLPKASDPH